MMLTTHKGLSQKMIQCQKPYKVFCANKNLIFRSYYKQYNSKSKWPLSLQNRRFSILSDKDEKLLFYASICDDENLIKNHSISSSIPYLLGLTPLHYACLYGNSSVAKKLLDLGHDVNVRGSLSSTFEAELKDFLDKSSISLCYHSSDIGIEPDSGITPLHLAAVHFPKSTQSDAKQNDRVKILDLLVEKGADVKRPTDHYQLHPMHLASMSGLDLCVRTLHKLGADPLVTDVKSRTPAFLSVKNGHAEVVRALMAIGVDFDICENSQYSLLHLAVDMGHVEVVNILLEHGIDINQKTKHQENTPLILATLRGDVEVVRTLLDHGAEINMTNIDGSAPIHIATQKGWKDIVNLLVDRKAAVDINDRVGKCAKDYANI